jgi:hypothetical protein
VFLVSAKDEKGNSRNMLFCLRHFHIPCAYFSEKKHAARISPNLKLGERAQVYETGRITTLLSCVCFQKFAAFSGSRSVSHKTKLNSVALVRE